MALETFEEQAAREQAVLEQLVRDFMHARKHASAQDGVAYLTQRYTITPREGHA